MRSLGPRLEVAVSLTILMLGAASAAAMHLSWPDPRRPARRYSVSRGASEMQLKPFEINDISGAPVELTPGAEGERNVPLPNPNGVDIVVESLSAVPGQPLDAPQQRVAGCPAGVMTVVPLTDVVQIPAGGEVEVT